MVSHPAASTILALFSLLLASTPSSAASFASFASAASPPPTFPFSTWSAPLLAGTCSPTSTPLSIRITPERAASAPAFLTCRTTAHAIRAYTFPPGVFQIDEQLLVPANTSLTGAAPPNDPADPTRSPSDWSSITVFLATRGATQYAMDYCHATDMVTTRVGFVLSSFVTVRDIAYQGVDTIRPADNGALCGGGAFETKGCAENNCGRSAVNNGGSDGVGSVHVTVDNVRINDYYADQDRSKVGASIEGNYDCGKDDARREEKEWEEKETGKEEGNGGGNGKGCCFCKPNGVRSSQVRLSCQSIKCGKAQCVCEETPGTKNNPV